ncbi:hypothetical protein ACN2AK_13435 [Shewanella xiamenensis]
MFSRVQPSLLTPRLDADFYKIEFIENEAHLKEFGVKRLAKLIDIKASGYGVLPSSNEYCDDGVPLIRGGDLSYGEIVSPSVFAPLSYKDGKGTAIDGDVLILIKGACIDGPEGVARVKQDNHGYLFNGSCFRLAFTDREVDGPFFIAYSQSKFFLRQKKRQVANTGISYNDEDSIHGYLIPDLENGVKKYIGDKVRQAEQLRAWAKRIYLSVQAEIISELGPCQREKKLTKRVNPNLLSDRLDQNHYQNNLLENHKLLMSKDFVKLGDKKEFLNLTDGDHGNPVYGQGPIYLRASEIKDGLIDKARQVRLAEDYASKVGKSCWANIGDVIFSVVGTLGLSAVVEPENAGIMSRGIAKVTPQNLPNYFVKAFFKSSYFSDQLVRHSVGTVQRGVYLSSIEHLMVSVFDDLAMNKIAREEALADAATTHSNWLIDSAKLLCEALIEGQLTEQQLIQAQQALDDGDNSLDQAILSKLSSEGYAIEGAAPLFSDIDELYRLLASAAQAEAEE